MANSWNTAANNVEQDDDVLVFSQKPNLSLQEREVMTRTACIIIKLICGRSMTSRRIHEYLLETRNPRDEVIFQYGEKIYGPNSDCSDFLRQPEISCIVFRFLVYVPGIDQTYRNYTSGIESIQQRSFFYTVSRYKVFFTKIWKWFSVAVVYSSCH